MVVGAWQSLYICLRQIGQGATMVAGKLRMMRFMIGRIVLVSLAFLVLTLPPLASAAAPYKTKARTAILIDAESGEVFFEKKADVLIPPASMSKIVTLMLAFDLIQKGKLHEDDEFEISTYAWRHGGAPSGSSTMFAKPGERIKLGTLMTAVASISANDAAIAIAEGIAGSEEAYARMLNKYARKIGLIKSHFANATGLPHPKHRMTARELAEATRFMVRNYPRHYKLFAVREFTWNKIRQRNRNPLLGTFPGADGVKTGYTREAGYSLVASAVRNGRRLIGVVTGLKSKHQRAEEARRLLNWGFRQFRPVRIYRAGEEVTQVRVWGGREDFVPLVTDRDVVVLLTDAERKRARLEARYFAPLKAPVPKGKKVGVVEVQKDSRTVARFPLLTGAAVAEDRDMWGRALDTIKAWLFGG